jgi:hypothetical protein
LTARVSSLEVGMRNTQGVFALGKGTLIGAVLAVALMLNGAADMLGKVWNVVK